jgi:uncharacterized protein
MMHRFIIALSCFLMTLAAPISAQDFEKGLAAYDNGDYATALKEWKPLADAGSMSAQYNIGLLYDFGRGVPQGYKEAVKWYRLAAEQGHADAQFNVGYMHHKGQGVLADFIIAHMWFNISSANGSEPAAKNRDKIAKNMTSEDISKAQAMARVCMNSNYEKCGY